MSRIIATLVMVLVALGTQAQQRAIAPAHSAIPKFDASLQPIAPSQLLDQMEDAPRLGVAPASSAARMTSVRTAPTTNWADMVGFTFFDLQTFGSNNNLIQNYANGDLSITYMLGLQRTVSSRAAGYNHYDAALGRWTAQSSVLSPGSLADSNNLAASPLARLSSVPFALGLSNGRLGWPGLIHNQNKEAIVGFVNYPQMQNPELHVLEASGAGKFAGRVDNTPAFDTLPRVKGSHATFHSTASDGITSYVLTTSHDTAMTPGLLAMGTHNNLLLYRSTNNGRNWVKMMFDDISISRGISSVKELGYAIDCRGSEVAIVANVMTPYPNNGVSTLLYRSSDYGNTWRIRVISMRTTADSSFRVSQNHCLATDGSASIVIDNNNVAHVTSHLGYLTLDSAGKAVHTFFINGGLQNASVAKLYYYNETMPEKAGFKTIAGIVDVDKNGVLDIPSGLSPAISGIPGLYPQAGLSMSNLTVGPNNELFVTYSAVVEKTHRSSNTRVTRDIYVIASYDGGTTWSDPINVAGRLAIVNGRTFDDGTSGSGQYEEAFPHAVKRIGPDGKLHMIFMSDDKAGMAESQLSISVISGWPVWQNNAINHFAIPIADIANSMLRITTPMPTEVCAGTTANIVVAAPASQLPIYGPITANSTFLAELDTSGSGLFAAPLLIGSFSGNATGGPIQITYPTNINGRVHFRVRVNNGDNTVMPVVYESVSATHSLFISPAVPATLGNITARLSSGTTFTNGSNVCSGLSIMFHIPSIANASRYEWSITPGSGGIIQSHGDGELGSNFALASFDQSASGSMTVSVKAINGCGQSSNPATFTFAVSNGMATYLAGTHTLMSDLSGGQWQRASSPSGPFVNVIPRVTARVLNVSTRPASTPKDTYYRYVVNGGCATNVVYASDAALLRCGTVPAAPTINIPGSTSLCDGGSVTLTATGGSRYIWSNDSISQSIAVTRPGTYSVRTIDGRCVSMPSTAITVTPRPTASLTSQNDTMTASPAGATYQWILNGTPMVGETGRGLRATVSGRYQVIVTLNGCADTSAAFQITSILDRGQRTTLTLSPNPATTTLHLTLSSGTISQVQVLDQLGRLLINTTEVPDDKLDVSGLAAGTYVVRVMSDGLQQTRYVSIIR